MKRLFPLLITPFLLACSSTNNREPMSKENSTIPEHSYDEIKDMTIEWKDVLNMEPLFYYGYVYSKTCSHCLEIKDYIIDYALRKRNVFFIEYSKSIPIVTDTNKTINTTSYEDIGILGTPTLLEVYNHTLIANIAGVANIIIKLENQ